MEERRSLLRNKSFLQGRIYFNNRRSSIDCLIRNFTEVGARLKFSDSVTVPEIVELYVPNREEMRRAKVEWRVNDEIGVSFAEEVRTPSIVPDGAQGDLQARVLALEEEVAVLRRALNELRIGIRKHHGED